MHYHSNHMWCSRSNWDGGTYDSRYAISVDKYERRSAFPSYEIIDEDWKALIELTPKFFDQEEYDATLERLAEKGDSDAFRNGMYAEGMATKLDVPNLKQEVIDWLNENVADNPRPYEQSAKGWCMGNMSYRANDFAQLSSLSYTPEYTTVSIPPSPISLVELL